jgi:hypothetical protein
LPLQFRSNAEGLQGHTLPFLCLSMVTIREKLESVQGANSEDVALILKHLEAAGFKSVDDAEGVLQDVDVAKLERPPDCGPLLYKHRLIVGKAVTGGFFFRQVFRPDATFYRSRR